MARANLSSVDTTNGDKIAYYGNVDRRALKADYKPDEKSVKEQVINARKKDNVAAAKAKAKKRAKLAKASRKKNKK